MKKICKFCKKKFSSKLEVFSHVKIKNKHQFYQCDYCKIDVQPKFIKNLYTTIDNSNYNFNKNIFYYLKQIILLKFVFILRKFFYKKKNILDYGCGSGELAITLSKYFNDKNIFTADVVNFNQQFLSRIKKHYLLQKGELKNKKFDIILMRHVLEHVFNLNNFLKKIKKNIKSKNSFLVIEVPNRNSLWRRIMKKRWPGYFYPFHYYVFSKTFLINYLNKKGFKIVKEQNLEPPIIGTFLLTYGVNKSICKILSIFFYPLQFILSKIFSSSEAILLIVKKN